MRSAASLSAAFGLIGLASVASAVAAPPVIVSTSVSGVTENSAVLEAEINPNGKVTTYRFEYGTEDCAFNPCTSVPVPEGKIAAGSSSVGVSAGVEGLSSGTVYHFRVVARNGEGVVEGSDRVFAPYTASALGLPDGRAYEQASPVNKNGGDV